MGLQFTASNRPNVLFLRAAECVDQATIAILYITGPPNGPVLFCWLVSVVCRRLSLFVMLPASGQAGRRAQGQSAAGRVAVGRPTLHGGPVQLRPVWATPCLAVDGDCKRPDCAASRPLRCIESPRQILFNRGPTTERYGTGRSQSRHKPQNLMSLNGAVLGNVTKHQS